MAKILYAWELGTNLGHVGASVPLARELNRRGHRMAWAVKDTRACTSLLQADDAWVQAPVAPERPGGPAPINYADILLRHGYDDPDGLCGRVVAWRTLYLALGTRLVLADHAPTAILAARTLGIPVMIYGVGFYMPPRRSPTPSMRSWEAVPPAALAARDGAALATINGVLARFDQAALEKLADLFAVAEDALLGFPELDHYLGRDPARYWGMVHSPPCTRTLPWPEAPGGKRIFAYLRAEHPRCRDLIDALGACGHSVILCLPGVQESSHPPNIRLSSQPLDLQAMTAEADAALVYGGISTATAFLCAGKPVLCVPMFLEQYLLGARIQRLGAGLVIRAEEQSADFAAALGRLVGDPELATGAARFAAKYAGFTQETVVANLAARVEELIQMDSGRTE